MPPGSGRFHPCDRGIAAVVGIYTGVPQESCNLLPNFHFPWIMAEMIRLLVGSVNVEGKRAETRRLLNDVPL